MFTATYLGSRTWSVRGRRGHLIIGDAFRVDRGHAPDAVFLPRERAFDPTSLAGLDRSVPIYVSAHASTAMVVVIEELGFATQRVHGGETLDIGTLRVDTVADIADAGRAWGALGCVVRDADAEGSLFMPIDGAPSSVECAAASAALDVPGLVVYPAPAHEGILALAGAHRRMSRQWARPAGLLIADGPATGAQAQAGVLAQLLPQDDVRAWAPGQRFGVRRGTVVEHESDDAYVDAREPIEDTLENGPLCGRGALSDGEIAELRAELNTLARHLYGKRLFRELYSLSPQEHPGKRPTVALFLRSTDREGHVFEYAPHACAFRLLHDSRTIDDYVAVFECWATDLLMTLRAEILPETLTRTGSQSTSVAHPRFTFELASALEAHIHPHRFPERFAERYRKAL